MSEEEGGDIRTIFLSGLPLDVVYREVHNFFRFMSGFSHCVLNLNGKVPTAFATFVDVSAAEECKQLLDGVAFDEDERPDMKIRVEWAKKNSTAQNKVTTISNPQRKRPRFEEQGFRNYPNPVGGVTTLFVANLGMHASEADVRTLFSSMPGMKSFKFQHGNRGSVAFVDFMTPQQAQAAMSSMQGQMLPTSTAGGIRIEFARSSMGAKGGKGENLSPAAAAFHPYPPAAFAAAAAAAASPYMNMPQMGGPPGAPAPPYGMMPPEMMYGGGAMYGAPRM